MTTAATLAPVTFLELEITGRCQLACVHCYAASGPNGGSGTMALRDWEQVLSDAQRTGVTTVQFIGGEPTLHPGLPRLMRYAIDIGLKVDVYTNLVHVTSELWNLMEAGDVSLGTSWYSSDPAVHASITGTVGSFWRTRTNIAEALRRRIPLRVGIVKVVANQDTARAIEELAAIGVTDIGVDRVRGVGRAGQGHPPARSQLCGRWGMAAQQSRRTAMYPRAYWGAFWWPAMCGSLRSLTSCPGLCGGRLSGQSREIVGV